jgi:hypothetical protein
MSEGDAEIEIYHGSDRLRLSASAATVLYPTWAEVQRSTSDIAARSEADSTVVSSITNVLTRDSVVALELRDLVGIG